LPCSRAANPTDRPTIPCRGASPAVWATTRAIIALIGVLLLTPQTVLAEEAADPSATTSTPQISLWDRPVEGTNQTYGDLVLHGDNESPEPILLPLPTPALAAAVGIGVVWMMRRRFGPRSNH